MGSVNQSTLHDHQASDQSTLHENSTQDQSTIDQSDLEHSVLDQSEKLSVPEQITSKSEATKSSSTSETAVSVDTTIMMQEDTTIMMQEDHTYHQIRHQSSSPSLICFPPNYSYGCLEKKWSLWTFSFVIHILDFRFLFLLLYNCLLLWVWNFSTIDLKYRINYSFNWKLVVFCWAISKRQYASLHLKF